MDGKTTIVVIILILVLIRFLWLRWAVSKEREGMIVKNRSDIQDKIDELDRKIGEHMDASEMEDSEFARIASATEMNIMKNKLQRDMEMSYQDKYDGTLAKLGPEAAKSTLVFMLTGNPVGAAVSGGMNLLNV